MPLFKTSKGLLFFAHVPRTGGSSVENYLIQRLGQPALLDRRFLSKPKLMRWSRTSPQHISADEFAALFPGDFVEHKMSVVRHPVSRVISIFKWLRSTRKDVESDFDKWLEQALSEVQADSWCHDGHLNCQVEFVPSDSQVFRLEEGLERVSKYIDSLLGKEQPDICMSHSHKSSVDLKNISSKAHRLIEIHYAEDFDRFKYSLRPLYAVGLPAVHNDLRITLLSPANSPSAHNWGEASFSVSLASALTKKGVETDIKWRDNWSELPDKRSTTLLLRAPFQAPKHEARRRLIWMLSHFDSVSEEELSGYDHILTCSPVLEIFFSEIPKDRFVFAPQCTDANQMKPLQNRLNIDMRAIFVGNGKLSLDQVRMFAAGNLSALRPALRLALESKSNLAVWGRYGGVKFPGHMGDTIAFRKLGGLYRHAGVILNDHTSDQVEFGALNNRIFDGLASGRPVLTTVPKEAANFLPDIVSGLNEFFAYDSPEKFSELLNHCLHSQSDNLLELSAFIRAEHSFDARAEMIVKTLRS
jgi:hypothetical protein